MLDNLSGKKVLIRVDFNVPLKSNKEGHQEITDDTRMQKALPTIQAALAQNAAVILASHLGRPLKKLNEDGSINKAKFSLKPLVGHLSTLIGKEVKFAEDCIGNDAFDKAGVLQAGEVLLLENTRFEQGEKKGDDEMAAKLAKLADAYINDAFGAAHRAHASNVIVAKYFEPEDKSLGLLMLNEINSAKKILNSPKRPFTAILGGAKVSDKILLIEKLLDNCDNILIGGGMTYTFIQALEGKTGNSLVEKTHIDLAKELIVKAKERNVELYLPEDSLAAKEFSNDAERATYNSMAIPNGWMGLDIGPKAIETYKKVILASSTVLWNGPLGVFEFENFATGTFSMAQTVADVTAKGAFTLIGGGDSVSAINKAGLADKVSFISTGGGAMLEYLEGKKLPGIAAVTS